MASSSISSPLLPSFTPLRGRRHSDSLLPPRPLTPSTNPSAQRSSTLLVSPSATNSRKAYTSEDTQKILESYGLDPSDFVSQPSTRSRRRRSREVDKGWDGKREKLPLEEPKPPRTTHKLLQVLGGKARRKKLLSPKGMDVRPMMEVVRGAAFDILQVIGGCPASLRPGCWLDLYSGTGSVGIEAMSRGCSEAHFVEMDPWVVSDVLRPNLEWTGYLDVSMIHITRVESFLEHAEHSLGKDKSFDYISVTPPYTAVDYGILMEQLGKSSLVGENCFILVEYPLKTQMSESCGHLIKVADRRFGRTNLVIYGPTWAEKKRKPRKASLEP